VQSTLYRSCANPTDTSQYRVVWQELTRDSNNLVDDIMNSTQFNNSGLCSSFWLGCIFWTYIHDTAISTEPLKKRQLCALQKGIWHCLLGNNMKGIHPPPLIHKSSSSPFGLLAYQKQLGKRRPVKQNYCFCEKLYSFQHVWNYASVLKTNLFSVFIAARL